MKVKIDGIILETCYIIALYRHPKDAEMQIIMAGEQTITIKRESASIYDEDGNELSGKALRKALSDAVKKDRKDVDQMFCELLSIWHPTPITQDEIKDISA